MTILAKPPRRGRGGPDRTLLIPESAAAATLRDLRPSPGWQDVTIALTHDQRFATFQAHPLNETLPKQPSLVGRPANRTVERLLHRSSSWHEHAVLHAVNSLPRREPHPPSL